LKRIAIDTEFQKYNVFVGAGIENNIINRVGFVCLCVSRPFDPPEYAVRRDKLGSLQ
jgi:hypothetical protein